MLFGKKKKQADSVCHISSEKGNSILKVDGLSLEIKSGLRYYKALEDVSFQIEPGQIAGLVGESGCGKSLTSLAIIRLLHGNARISHGQILLGEDNLLELSEEDMCSLRGERISMIFQDPMSALNPLVPVGKQIEEAYRIHHQDAEDSEAKAVTIEMMKKAGLSAVEKLYSRYPHQLSGGMKQRIIIAMALINKPDLIIADEPTTALDVTIQAQILELLQDLNKEFHSMILLISHDLGVIRQVCDKIFVMYGGRIVEEGTASDILVNPEHPYTKGLLKSVPSAEKKNTELSCIPGFVEPLEKRSEKGCPFAGRCSEAVESCHKVCPELTRKSGHGVRCCIYGGEM